ncbi:glycosyltransferase family 25 protein [Martelella alba]|uniref:Glycosyltransferase family 25 protein n=1 Tax=Martelella alba TaxID=2590451 RepID=A0A506UDY8_9HYPH|nr:glycosyltransferase family 25 protein [Martelella alba]TPW31808.1 glycosyltransferase family 25 protein [Martelella alba]
MTIFVINLDRSPDRMARMERLLSAQSLTFERFAAVDAKTLAPDEISDITDSLQTRGRSLHAGEVACYLSHLRLWREGLERNLPWICIFEDDIHLSDDAATVLDSADRWIPKDCDLVKIETTRWKTTVGRKRERVTKTRGLRRLHDFHWGTAGYIITRKGMETLSAASDKLRQPVDEFMFFPGSSVFSKLVIYQLDPAICIQDFYLPANDPRRMEIASEITKSVDERGSVTGGKARYEGNFVMRKLKRRSAKIRNAIARWQNGVAIRTILFR